MDIISVKQSSNGWLVNGNVFVPNDTANADCLDVLAWIDNGGVVSGKSQNEIKQELVNAIQFYLDTEAQAHFYDGILSLCSYATSTNPKFGPEGQAGVVWRDACWAKGYEILNDCEAGTRQIPTVEELLAEMPVMVWPE